MQPIGFLYLYPPNNYGIGAKNQTKNPKSHLRLLDYPIGREIHCLPAYRIGSHIYRCHGKYRQRRRRRYKPLLHKNYFLGMLSIKTGRKHRSEALVAGGKHLQSDTYSTIGLVAGLILVKITGITLIDSLMALIFGGLIIFTGISILRKTIATLTDKADPEKLMRTASILNKYRRDDWIDIHNLKILEYGSYYFIECDLTLPWYYTVAQGHRACESLEEIVKRESGEKITFSVHADSCNESHCRHCLISDCKYRRNDFVAEEPIDLQQIVESDEEHSSDEKNM